MCITENEVKKDGKFYGTDILDTNEIYKSWSGIKASEYKGIRKESLRDNMTDIEIALTDLGEVSTRYLAKDHKPFGLKINK